MWTCGSSRYEGRGRLRWMSYAGVEAGSRRRGAHTGGRNTACGGLREAPPIGGGGGGSGS